MNDLSSLRSGGLTAISGDQPLRLTITRRSIGAALLTALATYPASALDLPEPSLGLYDVMIPSNCFVIPGQENINNGLWHVQKVSVWPGPATIHLRTINSSDTVSFYSNKPALVQPKPPMQISGPVGEINYTRTTTSIEFNEPSQPTDLDFMVKSSRWANLLTSQFSREGNKFISNMLGYGPYDIDVNPNSAIKNAGVNRTVLRLYPKLEFFGLKSSVENTTITVGSAVSVEADFSYAHSESGLTEATFSAAKFQVGIDPTWHTVQGVGWPATSVIQRLPGKKAIKKTFSPAWPTNPVLQGKNVSTIKVRLAVTPRTHSCLKGLASDTLEFRLRNPNYQPNAPLPKAQPTSELKQGMKTELAPVKKPELRRTIPSRR